jgi:hypothetical protein
MAKTAQYLKDMKIHEVSLVMSPACPDADILFTKGKPDWRALAVHEAIVKSGPEDEPRDEKGRWTRIKENLVPRVKDIARSLSNRAKTAAEVTLGNTSSLVRTTRPRGAYPVEGGGVQFDFQHDVASGDRFNTSVQIRPEHVQSKTNSAFARMGITAKKNPAHFALNALHRALIARGSPIKAAFVDGKIRGETTKTPYAQAAEADARAAFIRTDADRKSRDIREGRNTFGLPQQQQSLPWVSSPNVAPTSTDVNRSGGFGWQPTEIPPNWMGAAGGLRPVGYGRKTDISDADAPHIPLPGHHTARSSGGWAFHTRNGDFIPSSHPDIQEHMEAVHNELRAMSQEQRANFITHRVASASSSNGKGYFTQNGDYIPPVRGHKPYERQREIETRYARERDRAATVARLHGDEGTPVPGGIRPDGRPAGYKQAKLFPPGTQEAHNRDPIAPAPRHEYDLGPDYDLGSGGNAFDAFRQDYTRKSLFPSSAGLPATHLFPTAPYTPSLRWDIGNGTPGFASRQTGDIGKTKPKRLF